MVKSFSVYGKIIPVKLEDDPSIDGQAMDGYFDANNLIIVINKKLSEKQQKLTLYHELIHALFYRVGISMVIDRALQEILCESISQFIDESFEMKGRRKCKK